MKNCRIYIAALVCAVLALPGCDKTEWSTGKVIRFGAGSQAESLTKTSYGDIVDGTPKKQMVNWQDGDMVRIACDQVSTFEGSPKAADYKTTVGTRHGSSAESRAKLSLAGNNDKGLRWGSESETHVFYGVYPSPGQKDGVSLTATGSLTGIIPEKQDVLSVNGSAPFVASPDMTNQYMVAKQTVSAGKQSFEDDEVFLYFTPMTTAIEFEVTNGMSGDLDVKSIDIISGSKNLSGTFSASLTGLCQDGTAYIYPAVTGETNLQKKAEVDFGTGLTLGNGEKLTFTIFLLPESDLQDLTFRIDRTDGTFIQTALKESASDWIFFGRCKKHFVKGLFVNEGVSWELCFEPEVYPWDEQDEIEKVLDDPAAAGIPSLISWEEGETEDISLTTPVEYTFRLTDSGDETQNFNSPTETGFGSRTIPVTSTKDSESEGWENEPQGWTIKAVGGEAVNADSYTTPDGLMTIGKDGNNLTVTDSRRKIDYGDNSHWRTPGTDWYREPKTGTIDLSRYLFKTSQPRTTNKMITANCYIVRNAGTYTIPLVYGNAIVNDDPNTSSYSGSTGSNTLGTFVSHTGKGIMDPFIENNTDNGEAKGKKNQYLKAAKAEVIWSEFPNIITITGNGIDGTAKTDYTAATVRSIKFTVNNNENLRQNNAIIAVKDADNKIMWSWHIWITNDPVLSLDAVTFGSYKFLPAPCLGWIEPPFYEEKDDIVVTLVQEESGNTIDITVKRPGYRYDGSGTYYQFGRKDPMPSKETVSGSFSKDTGHFDDGVSLAAGIQWPHHFWCRKYESGNWCGSRYDNLWTGTLSTTDVYATGGCKTVYDPSPVGYRVPVPDAFTLFCDEAGKCNDKTKWNVVDTDMRKEGGYRFGTESSNKFFPAAGYRAYQTGDIAHVGANAFYGKAIPLDPSENPLSEGTGTISKGLFTHGFGFNVNYLWVQDYFARGNGLSISPVAQ